MLQPEEGDVSKTEKDATFSGVLHLSSLSHAWYILKQSRIILNICFLQVVKFASKEDGSTPAVTDVDIGIVGYVCMGKTVYNIASWCWMCCRTI